MTSSGSASNHYQEQGEEGSDRTAAFSDDLEIEEIQTVGQLGEVFRQHFAAKIPPITARPTG